MYQRIFRVFVSSTFSDFSAERNVLQKIVFPELERRCRAIGGTFLGVDLRWGISPQRSLSNRTVTTCLEEIHRCQTLSPKPNFLILLGDRYGWIPLPETIPEHDWTLLRPAMADGEARLLDEWYARDENVIPSAWILKPRTGRWENQEDWEKLVEAPMGRAFRRAADVLPEARRLAYRGAATHQEIVRGLFDATDKSQVVAWCRKLRGAPQGFYSPEAEEQVGQLRRETLAHLGNHGVEREVGFDEINEFQDPSSIVADTQLTPYLNEFARTITDLLWAQIDVEANKVTDPGMEALQENFIRAKVDGIVGRGKEVGDIRQFLYGAGGIHMVTGPGGQGKTSLLALACRELAGEIKQPRCWIKRFSGAGGTVDSIEALLASIFPDDLFDQFWKRAILPELHAERGYPKYELERNLKEIGVSVSLPESNQDRLEKDTATEVARLCDQTKATFLRERSDLIKQIVGDVEVPRDERLACYLRFIRFLQGSDLVIVLDGLDQLYGAKDFLGTLERLGLADSGVLEGVWLIAAAREAAGVTLDGLTQDAWAGIAAECLQRHQRRLSGEQLAWLKSGWEQASGNPLSLRFGLERAIRMHSFDAVPKAGFRYQELLGDWIDQISSAEQHGTLARRALGLLSVAEYGLPESVLLELLASDAGVQDWFCTQIQKTGQPWDLANGLPPILWSRLRMDLGEVLTVSGDAGRSVLRLFHPAFGDELAAILAAGKAERGAIAGAAERDLATADNAFDAGNIPARFFENADPWALKELVVQWRHVAPAKLDRLMELPAFAFAVLVLPEAFDAWAEAEASAPPSGTLRALLKLHQTQLRLLAGGIDRIRLLLQEAFPKGVLSGVGLQVLSWTNEGEFLWIRNLQPANPLAPVAQGPVAAEALCRVSGDRLAIFLKSDGELSRLAVINPRRLGDAPTFMTVKEKFWRDGFRLAKFEDFVEFGDLLVTRHAVGPIRLWRNGKELARLVADVGSGSGSSGLRAEYFAKISSEEMVVLYEGGLVAAWAIGGLKLDEVACGRELKASASSGGFRVLFTMPACPESGNDLQCLNGWRATSDGQDFSLMLIDSEDRPVLLSYAQGALVVCRGEQQVHRGFDGFTSVLGMGRAAFWSLQSFSLLLLSSEGERPFRDQDENATIVPIACSGSRRTLYCVQSYRHQEGKELRYIDRLVALDWESAAKRWQGPSVRGYHLISAGEFSYLLFQKYEDRSFAIMRLDDEERSVPLTSLEGFWPDMCLFDAATGLVFGRSGSRLAIMDPESGASDIAVLESHVGDIALIGDLVAIAHGDGVLRTYRLDDLRRSGKGGGLHLWAPTCIARLGNAHLITASADRWLLWQADSPGVIRPSVMWEAGTSGKERRIYHVSLLENGCVTWGDEITFWRWDPSDGRLKEEHKIWDTGGGSLNCNGMVLDLGGNDFLFEYGSNYLDIPGSIGRVRWTGLDENGEWRENWKWVDNLFTSHATDHSGDRRWRSILSPVFPDGWVLVGETSEPTYAQTESIGAYNVHTEETRVGMVASPEASDPWLVELLERHRDWIVSLAEQRKEEMWRWGGGVTSDGGAVDMPLIYDFGLRPLAEDADSIVRFKQFQQLTIQRNFMFRDMLGMTMPSQRNIGLRSVDGQNVPYISASSFKAETSLVRELGMAIVTDRSGRMHWLQMMHGSRPCVGKGC